MPFHKHRNFISTQKTTTILELQCVATLISCSAEDLPALKTRKPSSSNPLLSFSEPSSDNTASSNFYNLFLGGLNLCQEKHCLLNGIIRRTWFLVVHVKFLVSCIPNDPYSTKEIAINSCFILCSDNWGKTALSEEVILRLGECKRANKKYMQKISRSGTDSFSNMRVFPADVFTSRALPFLTDKCKIRLFTRFISLPTNTLQIKKEAPERGNTEMQISFGFCIHV